MVVFFAKVAQRYGKHKVCHCPGKDRFIVKKGTFFAVDGNITLNKTTGILSCPDKIYLL